MTNLRVTLLNIYGLTHGRGKAHTRWGMVKPA